MPREGIEPSCIVMELYYLKTKNKRFKGYLADNPSAYGEDHLSSVHEGVDTELIAKYIKFHPVSTGLKDKNTKAK